MRKTLALLVALLCVGATSALADDNDTEPTWLVRPTVSGHIGIVGGAGFESKPSVRYGAGLLVLTPQEVFGKQLYFSVTMSQNKNRKIYQGDTRQYRFRVSSGLCGEHWCGDIGYGQYALEFIDLPHTRRGKAVSFSMMRYWPRQGVGFSVDQKFDPSDTTNYKERTFSGLYQRDVVRFGSVRLGFSAKVWVMYYNRLGETEVASGLVNAATVSFGGDSWTKRWRN